MKQDQFALILAEQQRAYDKVERIAAQLAAAAGPISHAGDGNCGEVFEAVKRALADAGLYFDPAMRPRIKPRKQVIKQGLRTKVLERDAYRCVHCGSHEDLAVDHIHPESLGGTFDLNNLQTLCRSCNSKKGSKV